MRTSNIKEFRQFLRVKTRLIPVLYIKNGFIVRSEKFETHQLLGNVVNEAARYNEWDVDELIYIDISREKEYDWRRDDHKIKSFKSVEEIIAAISKVCFMPLTFGGGIRRLEEVDLLIKSGADKIILNTGAWERPELISEVSHKYGSQCVVVSVDYRVIDGRPTVFTAYGENNTGTSVMEWVRECESRGCGEVLVKSIERDGMATGYDIETIRAVTEQAKVPIIACGGAGTVEDFMEVYEETKVAAIAAGNMFHFTERAYPRAKRRLKEYDDASTFR